MPEANKREEPAVTPTYHILTQDEDYGGIHPTLGVRFFEGEAITEDEAIARQARELGLTVRKKRSGGKPAEKK